MSTVEEAKAFEGEGEAVVIGLFKSVDSAAAKAYASAAGAIDHLPFAVSSSGDVSSSLHFSRGELGDLSKLSAILKHDFLVWCSTRCVTIVL